MYQYAQGAQKGLTATKKIYIYIYTVQCWTAVQCGMREWIYDNIIQYRRVNKLYVGQHYLLYCIGEYIQYTDTV